MPGTRTFFLGCLLITALSVVWIIGQSLTALTPLPAEVRAGHHLWRGYHCQGCHTIYGVGGAYAPDLTHIATQQGAGYLRDYLLEPSALHSNRGRAMSHITLSPDEITQMTTFLEWVSVEHHDPTTNEPIWPPRPLHTTGGLDE